MVADELTRALIEETTLEDISESYRPVVDIIGIEKFIELSEYAKGDELYFPKTENIIAPARNRRIKKEWNGYNSKELAEKYNLTTKQIGNILKDEPMIQFDITFEGGIYQDRDIKPMDIGSVG